MLKFEEISDTVLNTIAEKIPGNVRDLKGVLIQIIAKHRVLKKAVTVDFVNEMIETLYQSV